MQPKTLKGACPECGADMALRHSKKYDRPFYGCVTWPACEGTHGAHPDGSPLGTPADRATKQARIAAHAAFDPLWKAAPDVYGVISANKAKRLQRLARHRAYYWLADRLGIDFDKTHIGSFDAETCGRVERLCYGITAAYVREWWKARRSADAA